MDIIIYTNEGCIWCTRTKELMARANVEYTEVKWADFRIDSQLKLKSKYWSITINGFPVVIIDDEYLVDLLTLPNYFLRKD